MKSHGVRTRRLLPRRFHVASALMQDHSADPTVLAPDEVELRVHPPGKELVFRFRVDRNFRLPRRLGNQFAAFERDREIETRRQLIDAGISRKNLGRQRDLNTIGNPFPGDLSVGDVYH